MPEVHHRRIKMNHLWMKLISIHHFPSSSPPGGHLSVEIVLPSDNTSRFISGEEKSRKLQTSTRESRMVKAASEWDDNFWSIREIVVEMFCQWLLKFRSKVIESLRFLVPCRCRGMRQRSQPWKFSQLPESILITESLKPVTLLMNHFTRISSREF